MISSLYRDGHKKAKLIDKDTIAQIESSIKSVRQNCTDRALYNAAMYLWLNGRHEKSREYVDRMLKLSPKSKDGILLRGWIDLTCNKEAYFKKSIKYFEVRRCYKTIYLHFIIIYLATF